MNKQSFIKILHNWKNLITLRNMVLYKLTSILQKKNNGFYILNESWDNLIILDACRYDVFKEEYDKGGIKGSLEKRKSRGSHTTTFLQENFCNDYYDDIVYITANPYIESIKHKFYKVISVWKDGWDKKEKTVLPETMYEFAVDAIAEHPNKKLIIHFIQPHYPYIGYRLIDNSFSNLRESSLKDSKKRRKRKIKDTFFSIYGIDLYALIERKLHLKLYKNNLIITLPYIKKLIDILPGKTVLSADHGESLGEFLHFLIPIRLYGHNKNFRISRLVDVPWLTINPEEKDSNQIREIHEKRKILNSLKKLKLS